MTSKPLSAAKMNRASTKKKAQSKSKADEDYQKVRCRKTIVRRTGEKKGRAADIAKKFNVALSTARYWMACKLTDDEMEYRRQRARDTKRPQIEGVDVEELVKTTGLALSTLKNYAKNKIPMRVVEMKAQQKAGIENHQKVYCGYNLTDLADKFGIAVSKVSKMANLGVLVEDMPQYIEENKAEMYRPDGRPKRDTSAVQVTGEELRRQRLVNKNNRLLAMKL